MENIDPHVKVKTLPIAQRQMIEIAKALYNASIIAFESRPARSPKRRSPTSSE